MLTLEQLSTTIIVLNPLTAGADYVRFSFLQPAFKRVKEKNETPISNNYMKIGKNSRI